MNHLRLILGLFLLSASAQAALVQFIETAVNDADGSTIGAVSSNQFRETTLTYPTASAPAAWSSYRFTHWTNSGYPEIIYRDAWGRSLNPTTFVLLIASTATAHYLPAARDTDADGVPDWYEMEYCGNLDRTADSDTDGDGRTLLAEYTAGTNPLYGNSSLEGGVAWADSALVTCNLAGYPTYLLRSEPAGTVNQTATVTPGTVITTTNLSGNASFGYWTLDGVRQQDAWGAAYTQLTFTLTAADREAVAYLFAGDTDGDGVPDAYEQRYYGTLANAGDSDTDGDGRTLLAEYTAGTNPLYGNSSLEGGVAWADSALVTCNLAGYPTYLLRSEPAGTVNQTATVTPGTVITTTNLSGNASFGYWTLDGVRQQDAWGAAYTQLTFTLTAADREAVAYLFAGDTDGDGVPDAYEQRYYGTLANAGDSDTDGDGRTLLAEYTAGTNPLYGNGSREGGVAWADSALITADLQPEIAVSQPAGTDLPDGGSQDFGSIPVGTTTDLTFTVENHGGTDLTGLTITIDGADAAEFAVTASPTVPVVHNGSTTFAIRFAPVSVGAKTAAIHLANNDADENPFDLGLAGVGLNNAPTISDLPDIGTARNTATGTAFTIGDVETAVAALTLGGSSGNQALVPDANIVFTGSGPTRTVTINPAADQTGTAVITLTVSDGSLTASDTFTVTVAAHPPAVATGAATAITPTTATLNGTVNPGGYASTARFDHGPTTAYGSTASVTLTPANGTEAQTVSAALAGLEPWTTYHFRLTAASNQGAGVGDDATFTTAGVAPAITTQPQSQAVNAGADVSFTVVATGVPAPGYEWRKDGNAISGATGATLALTAVPSAAAGSYTVVVTNAAGSVTSDAAVLTVNRLAQTISFDALPGKQVTDAPFTLGATATSGLAVSYTSSNPLVATVSGNTVTITGAGSTTLTASQAGDATYLPADEVSRTLTVTGTGSTVLVADEFTGAAGAPPDAAKFDWGGQVAQTGAGQLNLSTDTANTSWLRSKAGAAPGAGETLVLRMRLYAYAEPAVYGDLQPRGLRVGGDANNAVEFYSIYGTTIGMRVRKDGVESSGSYPFPAGVYSMHDYEIAVTTTSVTFKVDGVPAGTFTTNIPTGVLNVYLSTYDGGFGNVPVSIESLSLTLEGSAAPGASFDTWAAAHFTGGELADPGTSGPNAVYGEDGLPNLVKYALGLDPKANTATGLPAVGTTATEWVYTYTRPADRPDLGYAVEVSTDLATWLTTGVTHERLSAAGGTETWQARYPLASAPRIFFRLKVTR